MKKLFFTSLFLFGMVISSSGQDRDPAMAGKSAKKSDVQAQGYIKGTPSNKSQDKQLKELDKEEKNQYAPKPKPNTKTTEPKGGVVRE